jgi:hypothetical protein
VENYFFGNSGFSFECSPLADQKRIIQAGMSTLLYMSDGLAQGGQANDLFVIDWRRGSGTYCPP